MRRMMLFIRPDTTVFGYQASSWSSEGRGEGPPADWEIGEMGVTLTRVKGDHVQIERIPWANIAKLTEQYSVDEFEQMRERRQYLEASQAAALSSQQQLATEMAMKTVLAQQPKKRTE